MVDFEVVQYRDPQSALGVGPQSTDVRDPVPVWYPVAPCRRARMAPGGSHWDSRVGDRPLRFLHMPLQHHHFGPRKDAVR